MTTSNPTRQRWREADLCLECGKPRTFGSAYCQKHKQARAEARKANRAYRFNEGDRVRVWQWGETPSGNPPDILRLPHAKVIGLVARWPSHGGAFYAVDFPAPYGRLQVLEKEMMLVE